MPPSNHESTVQGFLTRANYRNIASAKRDIMNALTHYRGLVPKLEKFIFNDGRARDLICLRGTIPVTYRGNTYNIPVGFWILDTHPVHAPICYVIPTADMQIKVSGNVDHNGKIYLPYLHEWSEGSSDIVGLIQICIITFGEMPPVFARQPGQPQPPHVPAVNRFPAYTSNGPAYPPTSGYQPPYPPSPAAYMPPGGPSYSNPTTQQPAHPPAYLPAPADPTGTITAEHLKASLRSAVEDKVRRSLREEYATKQVEMQSLSKIKDELTTGQEKLRLAVQALDRELTDLHSVCIGLEEEQAKLQTTLHALESAGEEVDPDEAVTTTTPLYKQLVNSYAEEAAIEDAVYYLGEALRQNVIDCEAFLKHVRKLSRRQFFLRATMHKCRQTAGLPA